MKLLGQVVVFSCQLLVLGFEPMIDVAELVQLLLGVCLGLLVGSGLTVYLIPEAVNLCIFLGQKQSSML